MTGRLTIKSADKTGFKEIEKFDPEKKTSGIFYYKAYRPNQGVYPLPGYVAALKYIEIEKEIAKLSFKQYQKWLCWWNFNFFLTTGNQH